MGGCTNCASKGGCSTRKGEERELLAQLLPELYPARRFGAIDDDARDGISEREGRRLARQAAVLLKAPAFFRAGEPHEACDYIYVLCVGREPCLLELRDAASLDFQDGDAVREKYLRVALSSLARVTTVQEVSFELDREPPATSDEDVQIPDGGPLWRLVERPSPGIYDPILLKRTRKLVELLVAAEITFLDFGLIENPPLGFDSGEYPTEYGQEPGIVNYLFYPHPPRAVATTYIPVRAA
jgi:hypothetical protein